MAIEAREIACAYDGADVLSAVTISLSASEFVAVAGPNGSGKSTLIRALSRVLRPRAGAVLLDGADLYALPARASARAIAVVPQETAMDFDFSCEEVVLMGRAPHLGRFESERKADREAAASAMERTGTEALRRRSVRELSGGERRRVLLARALAQESRYLLLDEPTGHLDIAAQVGILRLLYRATREGGAGVLAVMHDLNLAAAYADRIVLMSTGRVTGTGRPEEVLVEAALREVFGAEVTVRPHPETGRPFVMVKA